MAPRSRRMRAQQQAEDDALEPADDALDADEGALSDSSVTGRGTSRRSRSASGTARASRRSQASSSRQSSRKSARKELSPEEKAARKAAVRNTVLTVLIILVVGGGGAAAYFGLKEEPTTTAPIELMGESKQYMGTRAELARQFMNEARSYQTVMEKELAARNPDAAKRNLDAMVILLRQPQLGAGVTPNPEDPNIGDIELATRAVAMLGEVDQHEAKIRRLKEDRRADINFAALQREIAELKVTEDLDRLETAMRRFMENPVRPDEGSNPDFQARYKVKIDEVEANLHGITSERLSRLIKDTSKVVETINLETQKYIDMSQYGTALSLVDEASRNFSQADLKPVRQKVLSAAERGWETDKSKAENLYKDAVAPGVGDQIRAEKLAGAIQVLEKVVANYGRDVKEISGYVGEAERMLREYKTKL